MERIEIERFGARYCLTGNVTRRDIQGWAADPAAQFVYAVHSPWWSLWRDDWMPYTIGMEPGGIPCDPRGSVLLQAPADTFLDAAIANPDHYGRHRLIAFVAAFHSNVEVLTLRGWRPTSLNSWEDYNALLDAAAEIINHQS